MSLLHAFSFPPPLDRWVEVWFSVSFVAGIYSVELVSDSLYEWHVKLRT